MLFVCIYDMKVYSRGREPESEGAELASFFLSIRPIQLITNSNYAETR